MSEATRLLPDPSPRLAAAFRAVATRMQGLSFVNPAVEVEAVGFAPWESHWLGVMVTPWFMNLTLLPHDPAAWQPLAPGAKRRYAFPAGIYEFVGANDAVIGDYQVCSLFSPLLEFDDHASARLVATLAREALFDPANAEVSEMPVADLSPGAADNSRPGPLAQLQEQLDAGLSKRDFLRGRFIGGERDDRG
jgi:[NiFe] hydrogenase assembly HybE family chaperone